MTRRKFSVFGSSVWTAYLFAAIVPFAIAVFIGTWPLVLRLGLVILIDGSLVLARKWILRTVGYVEAEFIVGLLAAIVIALATAHAINPNSWA